MDFAREDKRESQLTIHYSSTSCPNFCNLPRLTRVFSR